MILKLETYNFHRLDLTRQAGFIVTVYDEDGLRLVATMPFSTQLLARPSSKAERSSTIRLRDRENNSLDLPRTIFAGAVIRTASPLRTVRTCRCGCEAKLE